MRKSAAPSQIFGGNKGKRNIKDVLSLLSNSDVSPTASKFIETCFKENLENELFPNENLTSCGNEVNTSDQNLENIKYTVVWGKPSTKKHKTWDGDGVLEVSSKSLILFGDDGSVLGSKNLNTPMAIAVGQILTVGSKVVEIIEPIKMSKNVITNKRIREDDAVPQYNNRRKLAKKRSFQSPFVGLYNAEAFSKVEQVALPPPPDSHQWKFNSNKKTVYPVKIDAFLSSRLREHQKEGIIFLYSCVMGFASENTGAILADEMGLGKTLQCISLIWTLLRQGPYGSPVIKRALIITPSTLCGTWQKEFLKWLGRERLIPYVIDNNNKPNGFKARPHLPVMIISYERFSKHAEEIESIDFDIIICDEAHRLKNANIKAAQALQNISCMKRILLTGTPIQNDLQEYFVLIDIANPGILGTYNDFKEGFVNPILTSQKPGCSEEDSINGERSATQLKRFTSSFILRRVSALLKDYLPTKTEYVICCKITKIQEKLYNFCLNDWWDGRQFDVASSPLSLIVMLKKICNSPMLLKNSLTSLNASDKMVKMLETTFTQQSISEKESSAKLCVLEKLISDVVLNRNEKVVIISCSTKMMDILGNVAKVLNVKFSRLDGSTPVTSRQTIVETFNSNYGPPILLLSSRAGGTGLSLPAASHLVLYDSDWNPAVDNQAMARIWREGQRKPVHIYRLLVTGSIEEKIYQRQMFKTGISDAVTNPGNVKSTLKLCDEELKELFVTNFTTHSSTHDMLECSCAGDGTTSENLETSVIEEIDNFTFGKDETNNKPESSINQLKTWDHFRVETSCEILQDLNIIDVKSHISFIFRKKLI